MLQHGARVNSKDIAGYTPLAELVGIGAIEATLKLVPLLIKHGADPNIRTRFREPIIMSAVMGCDDATIRALVRARATIDVLDDHGITAESMMKYSPSLRCAFADGLRDRSCSGVCALCGCAGALKRCGGCQQTFYCDRDCQRGHWRNGHKECAKNNKKQHVRDTDNSNKSNSGVGYSATSSDKDKDKENDTTSANLGSATDPTTTEKEEKNRVVDIVLNIMTTNPRMKKNIHGFTNSLTGTFSNDRMHKKNDGK